MRLLVYGMQSSGASTLAALLAQKPGCGAFVDIWASYLAPAISSDLDVVAKVVVTTAYPLERHQERFRPDRTVLVLRRPSANYRSLITKNYRNHCGLVDEKFRLLDRLYDDVRFDQVVHYEDLVYQPAGVVDQMAALGWRMNDDATRFTRRPEEIFAFNKANFPALTDRLEYGVGKFRGGRIRPELVGLGDLPDSSPVDELCPKLVSYYQALIANRGSAWREEPDSTSR
jgi:hypothetical protein